MKRISALTILLAALAFPAAAQEYADGIYRGFYYDGGIEQIAIQFELKDGRFDSLVYRGVKYKDGDYMSEDASDAQKAILRQYRRSRRGDDGDDEIRQADFRPVGRTEPPPV